MYLFCAVYTSVLASVFFQHTENIFPSSLVSYISVEKLCESYFCSFADRAFFHGSFKIFFLFDFQQPYSDIIRYSRERSALKVGRLRAV